MLCLGCSLEAKLHSSDWQCHRPYFPLCMKQALSFMLTRSHDVADSPKKAVSAIYALEAAEDLALAVAVVLEVDWGDVGVSMVQIGV